MGTRVNVGASCLVLLRESWNGNIELFCVLF